MITKTNNPKSFLPPGGDVKNLKWSTAVEFTKTLGHELKKKFSESNIEQRGAWLWIVNPNPTITELMASYLEKNYGGMGIRHFYNRGKFCVAVKYGGRGRARDETAIQIKYGSEEIEEVA